MFVYGINYDINELLVTLNVFNIHPTFNAYHSVYRFFDLTDLLVVTTTIRYEYFVCHIYVSIYVSNSW